MSNFEVVRPSSGSDFGIVKWFDVFSTIRDSKITAPEDGRTPRIRRLERGFNEFAAGPVGVLRDQLQHA